MSTTVSWPVIGGSSYPVPSSGEEDWPDLSDFLIALATAQGTAAQKTAMRIATTTPVTVATADCTVICKLSVAGAVAVTLPAGVSGQYYVIADGTGDAATNNITITPNGSETIDGAATLVLSQNYQAVTIAFNGSGNWVITSSHDGGSSGGGSTGTGLTVRQTSPTLITPTLGVATATTINKVTITAPAASATLTIANGKTFTASNTLTLTGTDGTSFAFPSSSDTVVTLTATQTLTNKSLTSPTITGTGAIAGTFTGNLTGNVTGNCSGSSGSTTGNAATATALQTGRAINGVTFDGTAAITVTAAAGTLTGTTLNSTVVTSSLTTVGALNSGSITSGFGSIDVGTDAISGGAGTFAGVLTAGTASPVQSIIKTGTSGGATATFTNGEIHFGNSDASASWPTITGTTTAANKVGLYFSAGANDSNTQADMMFDVRESDSSSGSDFATLTNKGWMWTRYGTEVMSLSRGGTLIMGPTSGTNVTAHKAYVRGDSGANSGFQVDTTAAITSTNGAWFTVNDNGTLRIQIGAYYSTGAGQSCGYIDFRNGTGTEYFLWQNSGTFYTGSTAANIGTTTGTVVGTQTSDERLKTNIRPTRYGLDTVLQLNPIDFEMDGKPRVGFGAQRTQPILPEAVYDTGDPITVGESTKLAMDYSTVTPILVKAIQELKYQMDQLKGTR